MDLKIYVNSLKSCTTLEFLCLQSLYMLQARLSFNRDLNKKSLGTFERGRSFSPYFCFNGFSLLFQIDEGQVVEKLIPFRNPGVGNLLSIEVFKQKHSRFFIQKLLGSRTI